MEKKSTIRLLEFTARWCSPCQAMAPLLKELLKKYPKVKKQIVDVDHDSEELARIYHVSALPTFFFFENNEPIARIEGSNLKKIQQTLHDLFH
jgi:thiol-disulfide isomerase/thioredoxin